MCELAHIEYNPTFDSIFNNCHLLMTLMIGLHDFFLEMSKKMLAKNPCPQ
jgi:hypothetical protein